jgi:inward rectifier potassium channel
LGLLGGKKSARTVRIRHGSFEVAKLGASRFDPRDPYYLAITSSWPIFLAAAATLLIIVNTVFALLYLAQPGAVTGVRQDDFVRAFFFSLEVISTAGFGLMAPASLYGFIVAGAERVLGITLIPVATGLLLVRFSRPGAGILFADNAVICRHEGQSTLMVRIANGRLTMLTGASASIALLRREIEANGETFRRYHALPLVNDRLPLFPITWTLMHNIDETSPLSGIDSAGLEEIWARLIVTVEAKDGRLGRQVEDIASYSHETIMFGKRYAGVVTHDKDGGTTADLTRISLVEEAAP